MAILFALLILLFAAVLPVFLLAMFIYKKDVHKEPRSVLSKLFFRGCLSVFPILICELILDRIFSNDGVTGFVLIFINTFVGIALVEEGFKWRVVKKFGYDNKEFDEVYDIIVYSVFASLGFATVENILYVLQNGFSVAFMRALLSIPGHTCFGVIMGYFFSRAKVSSINQNIPMYKKNFAYSLLFPTLFHTMYDTLIFYASAHPQDPVFPLFVLYHISSVIVCFYIVNMVSKVQETLSTSVREGIIINDGSGHVVVQTDGNNPVYNFCPICGSPSHEGRFCPHCGFKMQ